MLPIPVGTRHTVTFTANVWKPIVCVHCGCEFAYRKTIYAEGEASNFLWLNRQGAIDSARSQALENVSRAIANIKENYPCPSCGMYQPEMVRALKSENIRLIRLAGIGIALMVTVVLVLLLNEFLRAKAGDLVMIVVYFLSILIGIAAGYWYVRSRPSFASNAQLNSRAGQAFSQDYPVLRRVDLEALAANDWGGEKIPNLILQWPPTSE